MDIWKIELLSQNSKGGLGWYTPMSQRIKEIHVNSAVVEAMARYLAPALDLETVGCFLALHEI